MAVVNALRTKISLDSAQFQQSMAGVNRQLKALQQEQRAVTSSGTGFARGIDELTKKADVLRRTHELQQRQVEELRRRYEESRKATGENSKETQNAQIAYNKAVAEMNKTENALKNITAELERQRNPWLTLQRDLDEAGKKLQNIGKGLSSFGRSMSMRVTAPILGAGAAALKVGMDFEAGMSKVQALTNASAEEMEAMSDQAKHLGETTRFSASQAAEGMAFLGMAGWKTNEIIEGMPGLLNLAASSNMELGRAADITSNIMAAFNIQANEAVRVADLIAYAASNANTNVEQMGEAMKYVAPTANTLGLSIEDTAAAIMSVSDAGIQGSQAGRAFGTSLLRLSNPTSAMIDQMEELGVKFFDAEGVIKSLPEIIGELEKAMSGFTSEQKAAALATIFGTEAQRHWAILLDRGSANLRRMSNELENSEGTAERMAKTMQNNAKGAMVEFQSALEGVGIALSEHMIPAVTDIIRKGTDLVRKFGDLDKSTQQNIIKMGLFAAAIGPVAIVAGSLTTTIGGLVRVGSSLAGLLGTARGAGLLGRLALLGPAGPVGLAIAGITGLTYGVYKLVTGKEGLHDISTKVADRFWEQADSLEDLVNEYDKLNRKSRLSSEEFGRLVDIQKELETAQNPARVAELTEKYNELLGKSGLTNDEFERLYELNNDIIEQSPNVETSFTNKGTAIVESTDAVKEYIQSLRDMAFEELRIERLKALDNEKQLLEEIAEAKKEIDAIDVRINTLLEMRNMSLEEIEARIDEINDLLSKGNYTQEEFLELQEELGLLYQVQLDNVWEHYDYLQQQKREQQGIIEQNNEQLSQIEMINARMAELLLAEVDINWEKGEGLKILDERIDKLKEERDNLLKNAAEEEKSSTIFKEHLSDLDRAISKHESIREQIKAEVGYQSQQNSELDKQTRKYEELYEKGKRALEEFRQKEEKQITLNITNLSDIEKRLAQPITKRLNIDIGAGRNFAIAPLYADGTNYHPGGPFIAGEEGVELGKYGSRFELLPFGLYDRPQGYKVFTHDETKKILNSLNNIPAYATGARTAYDVSNLVNQNNMSNVEALLQQLIYAVKEGKNIVLNGRVVGREITPYVTEEQERTNRFKGAFA